jgi:hypothetical protein
MAKLRASIYVERGELTLLLNSQKIMHTDGVRNCDGDSAQGDLTSGSEYVLQWFAEGDPGTSFSITISSPREAEFHLKKTIGATGKEFGGFPFMIENLKTK